MVESWVSVLFCVCCTNWSRPASRRSSGANAHPGRHHERGGPEQAARPLVRVDRRPWRRRTGRRDPSPCPGRGGQVEARRRDEVGHGLFSEGDLEVVGRGQHGRTLRTMACATRASARSWCRTRVRLRPREVRSHPRLRAAARTTTGRSRVGAPMAIPRRAHRAGVGPPEPARRRSARAADAQPPASRLIAIAGTTMGRPAEGRRAPSEAVAGSRRASELGEERGGLRLGVDREGPDRVAIHVLIALHAADGPIP